jgi:hypothetical protein
MKATMFEFGHHTLRPPNLQSPIKTLAADVVVIPLTHPYAQQTTGGDAEAWTLADGVAGQGIIIHLATDGGGDGTLTPATSTDWATIVFADAGDNAVLMYVDDTVGWIIIGIHGKVQPPVMT